jgi:hypothetical protein
MLHRHRPAEPQSCVLATALASGIHNASGRALRVERFTNDYTLHAPAHDAPGLILRCSQASRSSTIRPGSPVHTRAL